MSEDSRAEKLKRIKHLVLDMDGTIYRGSRLFPCTLPFLKLLDELGIGHTFITNNSSRGIADYVRKLQQLGIPASRDMVYTSTDAVIEYLRRHMPTVQRIWLLGTPSMARHLESAGYAISDQAPQAVVVGFDTELNYARLCRTAWWISQQLPFIASHPDLVCPTDEPTVLVDCGAVCRCLTAATGVEPTVLGKPDPRMLDGILHRHHLQAAEIAVVGDRLYTDMAMAQRAGAVSILVLTGEATADDADDFVPPVELVTRDLEELGTLLKTAFVSQS